MAGVMKGRRLKFTSAGERTPMDRYEVAAVAVSAVLAPQGVLLGYVVRDSRSTDGTVGGRGGRLRRPGKGATVWRAEVPREQADHPRNSRTGERIASSPKTARQLQGCYGGGYRLEVFGQKWDRREDAALALAAWYDGEREG